MSLSFLPITGVAAYPGQDGCVWARVSTLGYPSLGFRKRTVIPPYAAIDEFPCVHSHNDKRSRDHEIDDHSDNAYIALRRWINEIRSDTFRRLQCSCGMGIRMRRHGEKRRPYERRHKQEKNGRHQTYGPAILI